MIESRESSGIYGFLLSAQGTSCSRPRGSAWSSPLRSSGSQDDQTWEAGPVEQSSAEAKSLKTKGQGTVRLLLKWAEAETDRGGGPVRKIKGLLSWHVYQRKGELKAAPCWSTVQKGKRLPTIEKQHGKRKTLTLSSGVVVAAGEDEVSVDVGEWDPGVMITSPCDNVSVSEG